MKKIQIGVMGSMADVPLKNNEKEIAVELGNEIAKINATLVYGFEGDFDSFSAMAANSAMGAGGEVVAFTWGKPDAKNTEAGSVVINTGQIRGGGREFSLVLSCDGIITIGGGSGTLMEMAMAYQFGIPTVAISGTGGWSDKLAKQFIDERNRQLVLMAENVSDAVKKLINEINKKNAP